MTNVLVTGAAGFLGFHLARALSRRPGFRVFCVDNFIRGEDDAALRGLMAKDNVDFIASDLTDPNGVAALPDEIDYLYHLAALNGTQNFYERPMDVIRCSTLPTIFLMEKYGRSKRLKRFAYAGTSEAYASMVSRFNWEVPTSEDVPLGIDDVHNPRWSYAGSKLHGEIVTLQGARSYGVPVSIMRYHNAYGPRMGDKHVVPDFLSRMKHGQFELYGYEDTRSFLYVDDTVRATMMVAESADCTNEIVNIGGKTEISILELAKEILKTRGVEREIALHPSPAGSVKRRAPNTGKLHRLTNFRETITLADGLTETARFYLDGVFGEPLSADKIYMV